MNEVIAFSLGLLVGIHLKDKTIDVSAVKRIKDKILPEKSQFIESVSFKEKFDNANNIGEILE